MIIDTAEVLCLLHFSICHFPLASSTLDPGWIHGRARGGSAVLALSGGIVVADVGAPLFQLAAAQIVRRQDARALVPGARRSRCEVVPSSQLRQPRRGPAPARRAQLVGVGRDVAARQRRVLHPRNHEIVP